MIKDKLSALLHATFVLFSFFRRRECHSNRFEIVAGPLNLVVQAVRAAKLGLEDWPLEVEFTHQDRELAQLKVRLLITCLLQIRGDLVLVKLDKSEDLAKLIPAGKIAPGLLRSFLLFLTCLMFLGILLLRM